MEVASTLAYYNMATITAVKSFIVQAPVIQFLAIIFLAKTFVGIVGSCGVRVRVS